MIATCNKCGEFKVPWDIIGKELMQEHLKECTGTLLDKPKDYVGGPISDAAMCRGGF